MCKNFEPKMKITNCLEESRCLGTTNLCMSPSIIFDDIRFRDIYVTFNCPYAAFPQNAAELIAGLKAKNKDETEFE